MIGKIDSVTSFRTKTLANGLVLVGETNPYSKSTALGCFVNTGSRDELPEEAGVSHFLEHMLFKGTPNRDALRFTFDLGNMGAQANAYTSEENTVYYATVIPEYFEAYHELLTDMLRPLLDPEEFETEKKVILEEIALYLDKPHYFLYERALQDYYGTHPVGNSVLGTTESISALTCDQMKAYFGRRYSSGNMILVATGNFDFDRFVALTEARCGSWQSFDAGREATPHAPVEMRKDYSKANIHQAHVLFLGPGVPAQSDDRYPLAVYSTILGDSTGSQMYWELVDTGIAESAGADNDDKDGIGSFSMYASAEPDRMDQIVDCIRRLVANPLSFSTSDLERAATKLASKVVLGGELPIGRLMAVGNSYLYRGESEELSEVVKKIRSVTKEDIERALHGCQFGSWGEFRLLPA